MEPGSMTTFDLADTSLRDLNQALHDAESGAFQVLNPRGAHAVAAGIATDITVEVDGSIGYYGAGMNQLATVRIEGNASTGLAENIMSGRVHLTGSTMMSAGATGHGGLVVIEGNAGARCGISMKGVDIVVGGNIGHMSAFMAQSGNLVVLGDAAGDLGDSIYEANLFVRGEVASLGSDCIAKEMRPEHVETLTALLADAGMDADPGDFTRYGSERALYNFHIDDIDSEQRDAELAGDSR
jgi:glutamate synthase domain-containing protein 3